MREARKGLKHSAQAVAKLKSRVYTEEHRARISAALKGRQVSEGTLNRLRTVSCLKVEVKDLETNKIEYYPSVTLAAKAIGSNRSSQRVPTPPSPLYPPSLHNEREGEINRPKGAVGWGR
jgi:hypothetical protein